MPIFIARQWIRHRTANVNEFSGRYSLMPMVFYTPENAQVKHQSKNNKQGRAGDPIPADEYNTLVARWNAQREQTVEHYQEMTENDLAKELARIDLPLSTYTQWYWKCDLHNLFHFLGLRVDKHAQWEFQQYGNVVAGMTKISHEAWIDYQVCSVTFSRHERTVLSLLQGGDADSIHTAFGIVGDKLSKREQDEFIAKLRPFEVPNFDLDLSVAKPGSFFEEKFKAATGSSK